MDWKSTDNEDSELSLASPIEMNTERAYYYCGYNNIWETKATAKHLGWKLTRTPFNQCEACALGIAKKSNLGDGESNPPKSFGELWGIDGMKLKRLIREAVNLPSRNCMTIAVNPSTKAAFIRWYKTKKGFIDPLCQKLHHWETSTNRKILRIRCDDAGENKSFQSEINGAKWKKAIQFI